MKVLHVDSALGWRGGQHQVWLTALGMAERGHDVLVACRRDGSLAWRSREAGLALRELPFRGDLWPPAMLALRRLAAQYRPDVVQLHDPHALAAGLFVGAGPRRIATRRVDFPVRSSKYARVERVIAVSRAIAGILTQGGIDEGRLRVVYEGVKDRPAQPGGRELLAALGVPPEAPVVGNVAALTDHKDHATLIDAAALLKERVPAARIVILGDGELHASLEARARDRGVADRVIFAGFRTDLDHLMPAFDVFCLSSHHEGLGTSLLDAMNFSRPIVATRAGGIPEAVEDGVTGRVVAPRTPRALADALGDVLLDAKQARAMGEAGRERFRRLFSAGHMVEATLRVYEELLKIRAILNPRAGVAADRARLAILDGPWPDVDLIETRAAGHARELAAEAVAAGCDLVLAAGGDGTANEVAWGLLGSKTVFGLVPVGSGNGLARTLRIPLNPRAAVHVLKDGLVRAMDVGFWNDRPFLNVAGAGLDAVVGADFHANGKAGGRRGVLTYVRLSLRRALGYEAGTWKLHSDGGDFEGRALIVAFVNGRQYGGGAIVAPRARLDDGKLDIVIFEDMPRLSLVVGGPRLFLGTVDRFRYYRHVEAAGATLSGPRPFIHHRDGEPEPEAERNEIRLQPRALQILVPRATAEDRDGPFGPQPA